MRTHERLVITNIVDFPSEVDEPWVGGEHRAAL
jgi:hypothetical protein